MEKCKDIFFSCCCIAVVVEVNFRGIFFFKKERNAEKNWLAISELIIKFYAFRALFTEANANPANIQLNELK